MGKPSKAEASTSDENTANSEPIKLRFRKPKVKLFRTPFEIFREANPEMKWIDARTNFSALKEKKLLKYIKESESIYDAVIFLIISLQKIPDFKTVLVDALQLTPSYPQILVLT